MKFKKCPAMVPNTCHLGFWTVIRRSGNTSVSVYEVKDGSDEPIWGSNGNADTGDTLGDGENGMNWKSSIERYVFLFKDAC